MGEESCFCVSTWNRPGAADIPFGGCARPLGVLSAIDICFKGELICMASLPLVFMAPLTGDERKNSGDEDATFCCDARGVTWD